MFKKHKIHECNIINLPIVHQESGKITVLENNINIPFNVSRVYYLYDVPMNAERGGHAHYELEQLVIAASGSFNFILDDGSNKKEITLKQPNEALYIKSGIWREIKNFSSGSICLVLASLPYDETDYIRNYNEFLNYRKNG